MRICLDRFRRLTFEERSFPLALLAITIAAFGLLAPSLGYYQDDWPYVFYAFNKGIPSLTEELYWDSRPNAAWLYIGLFHLLGFRPLPWHIAALLLRWLTGTTFWYGLRRLWPGQVRGVSFAASLFVVHPFFLIQPAAVNSILYWAGFLFFAVSIWLMTRSVSDARFRIFLVCGAVILEAVHLFTSEYFVGLVLIRPLILFWLLKDAARTTGDRLRKTLAFWLPYLAVLASFVAWRMFLFVPPPGGDRNAPRVLFDLLVAPIQTMSYLLRTALQDSLIVSIVSWYRALGTELFAFASVFDWIVFFGMLGIFAAALVYLSKLTPAYETPAGVRDGWPVQGLVLGLIVVVLGLLPAWLIGQDIVTHKNQFAASRFGIGSTLGAALIVAAMIQALIDDRLKQAVVVSALAALAVALHLNNADLFRFSWDKQVRFYQQLAWRAPAIEPGTAFASDQEFLPVMGQYATSFGIITAYQPGDVDVPPFWYFPLYNAGLDIGSFVRGTTIEHGRVSMLFTGQSTDSLIINFEPELDRCLWILRPEDQSLRLISEDLRQLTATSALSRIHEGANRDPVLPEAIFGSIPNHGWCYFFERADLARQFGHWAEVLAIWARARSAGEQPGNGFEYMPFIEALAHQDDWAGVNSMTRAADKITAGLQPSLCESLDRLVLETTAAPARETTVVELKEYLVCSEFQ